jgi:hypothetical protein
MPDQQRERSAHEHGDGEQQGDGYAQPYEISRQGGDVPAVGALGVGGKRRRERPEVRHGHGDAEPKERNDELDLRVDA